MTPCLVVVISFKEKPIEQRNDSNFLVKPTRKVEDMTPDELMQANPALKKWMENMMRKKNKERPQTAQAKNIQHGARVVKAKGLTKSPVIKSPSDTTIYTPALHLNERNVSNRMSGLRAQQASCGSGGDNIQPPVMIETPVVNQQIENFLDQARRDCLIGVSNNEPRPGTSRDALLAEADRETHRMTVEAEKHKANISLPRGMLNNENPNPENLANGDNAKVGDARYLSQIAVGGAAGTSYGIDANACGQSTANTHSTPNNVEMAMKNRPLNVTDDEFFHLTCHVDPNLKQKIERGEFVDLEKLLIRDRFHSASMGGQRMELVSRGGETYIMPVEKDYKITNVRKWEQAFRIYAAIYSQANPHRSSEIWQYVFVINSAASSYVWENVASYDYTFRQLMACNPLRNWSNIYHQMWNLTMRDSIPKNGFQNGAGNNANQNKRNGRKSQGEGKRVAYCWSFNRGEKCKFDPNCKFVKRCSYCDSTAHGQFECPKLKDRKNK